MSEPTSEQSIFLQAIALTSAAERAAYLDEACRDKPKLRAELDALLVAHDRLGDELPPTGADLSGPEAAASAGPPASSPEAAGMVIGPYKLIEQIGEGGMGTVWMAQQQEPVKRVVAVKLIKAGMDSKQVIARFEAERQALALMDHPNIAKVLDGGTVNVGWAESSEPTRSAKTVGSEDSAHPTHHGRPYFVMDLVKGVPITKYCDEHRLTPRQRLELFLPVCQAIQHAHQKGIIHRDLKPSNVLVALYDGKPVPKVIDFGVAKAAGQPLTEQTLVTGFGAIVGTLEYMSPEQAEINQLDIDTRSDIYSLGVLLYELLAGSPPFTRKELEKAGMLEMLRVIREQEPSKPSTKLSTADGLPTLAANRGTEPAKLTKLVRGELDWIVMKALEKDRNRRYETANGFAMDVQRYLADEPVLACPPSVGYRLRKFVRRKKTGLAVAALLLFILVLLGSGVGWTVRDRTARQAAIEGGVNLALKEAGRLQKDGKYPEALSAAKRAEGILAGGGGEALRDRVGELRRDLEMVLRLEETLLQRAVIRADAVRVDREYARAFAEYGIDVGVLEPQVAANRIRTRSIRLELAIALDEWALTRKRAGNADDQRWKALSALARATDADDWRNQLRDALERPEEEHKAMLTALAENVHALPPPTLVRLATELENAGAAEQAVAVLRAARQRYPGDLWINAQLAYCLCKTEPPQWGEAVRFGSVALTLRPDSAAVHNNLGPALAATGNLDEAIAILQEAVRLKPDYPKAHNNLGKALRIKGSFDQAITACNEAIRLDPTMPEAHYNLGLTLLRQRRLDDALTAFGKAIQLKPNWAYAYSDLGVALHEQHKLGEAIRAQRKAIELKPDFANAHNNLGWALYLKGDLEEAIKAYEQALRVKPDFSLARNNLAMAVNKLAWQLSTSPDPKARDLSRAVELYNRAVKLQPDNAMAHYNLGLLLVEQRKLDDAIAAYRKAVELKPDYAKAYTNLGVILEAQGKLTEAIAAYRRALEIEPEHVPARVNLGNALKRANSDK